MNTIDCTDIKALLSAYIDGELDDDTRHLAERHLGECSSCRELIEQAERLDALVIADIESTRPAGLSPDFFGAVMSRTVYAEPQPRHRFVQFATWTGWTAAAAAFALAGGIWINQQTPRSTTSPVAANDTMTTEATESVTTLASTRDYYSTGLELASETFKGALPAAAFTVNNQRTSVSRQTEPTEQAAASRSDTRPRAAAQPELPLMDEASLVALMTPHTTLVSSPQRETDVTLTSLNDSEPRALDRPTIERHDADTLYAASILMDLLLGADTRSFADVEHVRRVVEVDNLLPRLTAARDRLQPADRPAVLAAESVLTRVAQGPLDSDDVASLRDTVAKLDLSHELGSITERWDRASSM